MIIFSAVISNSFESSSFHHPSAPARYVASGAQSWERSMVCYSHTFSKFGQEIGMIRKKCLLPDLTGYISVPSSLSVDSWSRVVAKCAPLTSFSVSFSSPKHWQFPSHLASSSLQVGTSMQHPHNQHASLLSYTAAVQARPELPFSSVLHSQLWNQQYMWDPCLKVGGSQPGPVPLAVAYHVVSLQFSCPRQGSARTVTLSAVCSR